MELVYIALPVALVIAGAALAAFVWAARDDQFEDLDTPARRALFEDLPVDRRPGAGGAKAGDSPVGTADSEDGRRENRDLRA
ncbi:MAG: cbb3-type cytochrome oxidase assembly protein CcoS [Planctomycetota bacterium]